MIKKYTLALIVAFILGSCIPAAADSRSSSDSAGSWVNLAYAFDQSLIFSTQANDVVLVNGEKVSMDQYGGIYRIFPDQLPEYGYILPAYDIRSIHAGEDILVYTQLYDDGVSVIGK